MVRALLRPVTVARAKALIVGDSGVGKSGLARRLKDEEFAPTASTHGAKISIIKVTSRLLDGDASAPLIGEIELWDLAGQPDYNAVHQIFTDDASVALVVIDESQEDALVSVSDWVLMAKEHCPDLHAMLLVSARTDIAILKQEQLITETARSLGFNGFFRTSAKTLFGVENLRRALLDAIDWPRLPRTTMPGKWHSVQNWIRQQTETFPMLVPISTIQRRLRGLKLPQMELETILAGMHARGRGVRSAPSCR